MEIRASLRRELLTSLLCLALLIAAGTSGCALWSRGTEVAPTETSPPPATLTPAPEAPTATVTPYPTPTANPSATPTATASPTLTPTNTPPPPSPTPSATPRPPTATATAAGPVILSFAADVEMADPGDTVTLTWSTSGATRALIYKLLPTGQLTPDSLEVPPSGSTTYTVPPEDRNSATLMLYVEDAAGRNARATTSIGLRCPDPWFFAPDPEDVCPTEPLVSWAAEQHFEGGTMIWVEAEDAIYVLYSGERVSSRWQWYQDRWDESQPAEDPDLEPPPGLQQPRRGFGLVWRSHPEVREGLGWATDDEHGFATVMQRTTRFKYNAWYLLALDGNVWYLGPEGSTWAKLTPESLVISPDG